MAQRQIVTAIGMQKKWGNIMVIIGGSDGPTAVFISWSITDIIIAGMFLVAAIGAVILACWLYRRYKGR